MKQGGEGRGTDPAGNSWAAAALCRQRGWTGEQWGAQGRSKMLLGLGHGGGHLAWGAAAKAVLRGREVVPSCAEARGREFGFSRAVIRCS